MPDVPTRMGNRANRDFATTSQPTPTPANFVGGSNAEEPWGIIRSVDGHNPTATGNKGSNVHDTSGGDPLWDDAFSEYDPDTD